MGSDDNAGLPPERQKPAPTIDLKASEVSSRPIGDDKPKAETKAEAKLETKPETKPDTKTEAKPKPADAPKADTASKPAQAEPAGDPRPAQRQPVLWAGAAAAALALFGLGVWLGMSWMNRDEPLAQITARLTKIEASLANAPAADAAIKMTADNVAALNRRLDDIAKSASDARSRADAAAASAADASQKAASSPPEQNRADTDALSNRIAALEQTTRTAARESVADDKVSRRAVVASALRDAVERGAPFTAELAAAKSFASDAPALAPLDEFAATGVPSVAALGRDLSALTQPMMKAIGEPAPKTGSVLEKLQASAEKLVRIRPVGEAPGNDPAAIVGRIEAKAARNDIAGAREELAKLPVPVRAPAEGWLKRAASRDAALAASRQFAQDSVSALGKPSL